MRLVLSPTTIGNVCILYGQCVKLSVTLLSGESLSVRKDSMPELMKCSGEANIAAVCCLAKCDTTGDRSCILL
jgi:hypothetical protein